MSGSEPASQADELPPPKPRQWLRNALSLYGLQALNVLVPLITLPYLTRTLGIANFGTMAYALSIIQLVVFLTEFSFNLTATRRISTAASHDDISRTYSVVTVIRGVLALLGLAIVVAALFVVPSLRQQWTLYAAISPMVFGELLFPVWVFQGLQKMQYLPLFSAASRALGLVLIVALVRTEDDLLIAAAAQAVPFVLTGLLAQAALRLRLRVLFRPRQPVAVYREVFYEAGLVFLGRLAGQVYTRGALLMLGAFATASELGYFSIAQRISALLVGVLVSPISQSLYPHLCILWERAPEHLWRWRRRMILIAAVGVVVGVGGLNAGSSLLSLVLTGSDRPEFRSLLLAFSPAIAFTLLNVLLATILTAMRRFAALTRVLVLGAATFLLAGLMLTPRYGAIGMAVTSGLVEAVVFLACMVVTRRGKGPRRNESSSTTR